MAWSISLLLKINLCIVKKQISSSGESRGTLQERSAAHYWFIGSTPPTIGETGQEYSALPVVRSYTGLQIKTFCCEVDRLRDSVLDDDLSQMDKQKS